MSTAPYDHTVHTHSVTKPHIFEVLQAAINTPYIWAARAAQRRELRELLAQDERIIRDVGLKREDVAREAFKAFWRE